MQTLDDNTFNSEVLASQAPVMVKLTARWCSPCKAMQPGLEQVAATLTGMKVFEVDIDRAPMTQLRLGSPSIPTLVIFRAGREVARHTGAVSAPWILNWVKETLVG
jgi:thioredoxin-like negative regulator of GroEL